MAATPIVRRAAGAVPAPRDGASGSVGGPSRPAGERSVETGLRERKKRRTRDQLVDAAFELFGRNGFEAVSVDEIAQAVDVSARTFFRYFAGKEDVVLQAIDEQCAQVMAELDRRPADEPVLGALRNAMVTVLRACEREQSYPAARRFTIMLRLLTESPALAAHSIHRRTVYLNELAERVTRRMGADPGDPRAMLVAAVVMAAIPLAGSVWRRQEPDTPPSTTVERAFRLLEAGLDYPAAEPR